MRWRENAGKAHSATPGAKPRASGLPGKPVFHNYLPDLKIVWGCLGFGFFGIVLGCLGWLWGTLPHFHSLWLFSSFTVMFLHYANRLDLIPQLPCATVILPKEPGKHNWVLRNWQRMKVELSLLCSKDFQNTQCPWTCSCCPMCQRFQRLHCTYPGQGAK